jgi:hypothetical protein
MFQERIRTCAIISETNLTLRNGLRFCIWMNHILVTCRIFYSVCGQAYQQLLTKVTDHPSIYSCWSHLEHRASVKRFVSLQFLRLRESVGLLGWGSTQYKPLPTQDNTEWTQTYTHALSGIRTQDPSVRASEDSSCLRPRGNCDRHRLYILCVK